MTHINYWLREMIKDTPNDAELGNKIRQKSSDGVSLVELCQ